MKKDKRATQGKKFDLNVILYFITLVFSMFGFSYGACSFTSSPALFQNFQEKSIHLSLEDKKTKDNLEKSKSGSIGKYIEKIKNPSEEYDTFMKKLLRSFFTGYGLRILVFLCVVMIIFFFFRTRNLLLVMLFYILGNLIMFFGHLIAKYVIK